MPTRRNMLVIIFIINSLVMLEAARFLVQQIFFTTAVSTSQNAPIIQQAKVEEPTPPPKVIQVPEPLPIEQVVIKPKPTPIPPLPKVTPKPAPKLEPQPVAVKPAEPVAPPKPAPSAKLILDNFNDSSKRNILGGYTGTFGGTGGFCLESYQKGNASNVYEEGGYILKLVYNVNNGYAGYYSKLNGVDLTKFRRVSFYVKGAKGGEVFEIELGDGENASKVDIREYLPYGASTTWQRVSIPLKAFTDVKNWTQMNGNYAVVFEQYLGTPTNSTLYIDNVIFEE